MTQIKKELKKCNALILIVFLIGLGSCQPELKTTEYAAYGIRLSLPEGWKKTEQPILDLGVQILIEKEGEDESGQFILNILNKKIPIEAQLQNLKKGMSDSYSLQAVSLDFTADDRQDFNGVESIATSFKYQQSGLDFVGLLRTMQCGDQTISILIQEELDDARQNKAGFEILKNSLTCTN